MLPDGLLARFLKEILERVPRELNADDVEYLLAHPEEISKLLEPFARFHVPYPVHTHHYGPVVTIAKEQDLRQIMTHWLRGGRGLSKEQLSAIVRQRSRALGKQFRPFIVECTQTQTTEQIRKKIARHGWRPGKAFELVTYLSVRQSEPVGARRLIALADDENDMSCLVLMHHDFTYSAEFVADPGTWTLQDHFFAVRDGNE
jgi:hypothetical protein